jgi:hypothetical protein
LRKPIRIKVENNPSPNLRKLARALLLLVEQQAQSEEAEKPKREEAS